MDNNNHGITQALLDAIAQYKNGNQGAFSVIYAESEKYLYTCANKLLQGFANQQGAVIDVLCEVYKEISVEISHLFAPEKFLIWAGNKVLCKSYRILQQVKGINWNKERITKENFEGDEDFISDVIANDVQRQKAMKNFLDTALTDEQKLCVAAFYYNEQPVSTIAQNFGVDEKQIRATLKSARKKLKEFAVSLGCNEYTQFVDAAPWLLYFFLDDVYVCVVPQPVHNSVAGVVASLRTGNRPQMPTMPKPIQKPVQQQEDNLESQEPQAMTEILTSLEDGPGTTEILASSQDPASMTEELKIPQPQMQVAKEKVQGGFFSGLGGKIAVAVICLAIIGGTVGAVVHFSKKDKTPTAGTATAGDATQVGEQTADGQASEQAGENALSITPIRTGISDYVSEETYEVVDTPSVPTYEVADDFSNVINREDYIYYFENYPKIKEKIKKNGFVVTQGYNEEFFSLYENNRYEYRPNFVTTDSLLHTYHLYFQYLMKQAERTTFTNDLAVISQKMVEASKQQYEALAGTTWESAAKRNLAYFSVGQQLITPGSVIDPLVSDVANEELALIAGTSGIGVSPVMAMDNPVDNPEELLKEDYTQYIVRGYYTEDEALSNYFRAMMWYGRISFRVDNEEETKSAILMAKAMKESEAMTAWSRIYDVTSFFVGNSDDPGIYDYYPVLQAVYGDMNVSDMANAQEQWNRVYTELRKMEPPKINSVPVYEWQSDEEKDASITGFRFMGQRATFDAQVFQNLIYDSVKSNPEGENRMLPSALDVPAVLGSKEAKNILQKKGAFDYAGYEENFKAMKESVKGTEDQIWDSTLYNSWMNMLRPLTVEKGEGYPMFMQNQAWTRKQLNTFLGSYAELKHDSVLYAKQVYAEMGGGEPDVKDDRGYVEPEPQLYASFIRLAKMTREGLKGYGMLSEQDEQNLLHLEQLAQQLLTISNKELRNEGLTDEEYDLIRTYGGQLEHFWNEALRDQADENGYLSVKEHPAAIVTDIVTDPNGSVLEIGTGAIDTIYVIVNVEGSLRIASGCVYSYYEFSQPMNQRLTDQEWRYMLGVDTPVNPDGTPNYDYERTDVEQPAWIKMFKPDVQ
ncbi:MAG: DUF3160 domain-containing protein [Wujia sp.]